MGRYHRSGQQHGALEGADPEWQPPFRCGEYARALDCYQQALWLARQQFADWHDADEAVAALVVAHHNLADLLVARPCRIGPPTCCVTSMIACWPPASPPTSSAALREAAVRHARSTRTELLAFLGKHGHHDGIQRSLGQCLCQTGPAHQLH